MRRRGFTLVELLVVIGIIGVLLGILIPAIGEFRKRARENACTNNQRQIFQAIMLSSTDLGGYFPRAPSRHHTASWANGNNPPIRDLAWAMDGAAGGGLADFNVGMIWRYMGTSVESRREIMLCQHDRGEIAQGGSTAYTERNFSYSLNSNTRPNETGNTLRVSAVRKPAQKILIYEELGPNDGLCTGPGIAVGEMRDDYPSNRHGREGVVGRQVAGVVADPNWAKEGGGIHCFFDGHVEQLKADHLMTNASKYHSNLTN